ncbi:hypothetical protein ACLMJK_009171 [Lecanora helva]
MTLSPYPRCSSCGISGKLYLCQGCHVVHYCGRDHQVSHRDIHKDVCNEIKRGHQALSKEERRLRNIQGDVLTPDNLFVEHRGQFWGILETRTYMRHRFALVEGFLKVNTCAAVQAAQEYLMESLYLCRSDNMGVRDLVPFVDLRLNKDQECYDFCKWWETTGQDSHYDWGNLDNPYLNCKGSDVFEADVDIFMGEWASLNFLVTITLLKIRVWLTMRAYRDTALLSGKTSRDLLNCIRDQVIHDTVLESRRDILTGDTLTATINELQGQIQRLYKGVNDSNAHFWPALLNPGKHLRMRPEYISHGSKEEMQLTLKHCYGAWTESPGALDIIRRIRVTS